MSNGFIMGTMNTPHAEPKRSPGRPLSFDREQVLERAMHASTFNHVGVARVLDVVTPAPGDPQGVLGVVIAEWTHGTDLIELVGDGGLQPGTAARMPSTSMAMPASTSSARRRCGRWAFTPLRRVRTCAATSGRGGSRSPALPRSKGSRTS